MAMGMVLGCVYTLFLVVPDQVLGLDGYHDVGGSAGTAFRLFLFGGAAGGLIAGTALPLARSPLGAWVVGTVASFPFFYVQSNWLPPRPGGPEGLPIWGVLMLCGMIGGSVGLLVRTRLFGDVERDA